MIESAMDEARFEWITGGIDHKLLTPWEKNFVHSIEDWWEDNGFLTIKQAETLEKIYKEKGR